MLSACSRPDQALHDTYYVVSNTSSFLFLATLTVIVAAAWTAILRLSKPPLRKAVMAAVATFALGVLLLLAPYFVASLYDPTSSITALIIANRLALIGAAAVALTSRLTLGILIVTGFSALLRNR